VLTIPPSAYQRAIVPGLVQELLPQRSREALLGSSRPPEAAPSSTPGPAIDLAAIPTKPAPEENRDAPPNPLGAARELAAETARSPQGGAGFTARRGPRRVRVPRRRD
jgi:hypothetical protein